MPTTLSDACSMLADAGTAGRVMAGGTDLLVDWPQRAHEHDDTIWIDLSRVTPLRRITCADHVLRLGALTTYWDVVQSEQAAEAFPLLKQAARVVGSLQIQTRGTWAGNIMNGSPAADGVLALMAYDTTIELRSTAGVRRVSLDTFYTGYRSTVARADEILESIVLRRHRYRIQYFEKIGTRQAQAITKVGLALTQDSADHSWRVVMNSMAPTVTRCPALEGVLSAQQPMAGPDAWLPIIDADVSPIDDLRSTSRYRRVVAARLLHSALADRCDWIGQ
ncbi:MAG: hypothetical protein D8M59_02980 [Planctomycetes bacterium]|nr:hypothetical protein [Planctomycetota bacterium]NOG52960.1 hypothetical protein [Planctomycetota bacterium]